MSAQSSASSSLRSGPSEPAIAIAVAVGFIVVAGGLLALGVPIPALALPALSVATVAFVRQRYVQAAIYSAIGLSMILMGTTLFSYGTVEVTYQ